MIRLVAAGRFFFAEPTIGGSLGGVAASDRFDAGEQVTAVPRREPDSLDLAPLSHALQSAGVNVEKL